MAILNTNSIYYDIKENANLDKGNFNFLLGYRVYRFKNKKIYLCLYNNIIQSYIVVKL